MSLEAIGFVIASIVVLLLAAYAAYLQWQLIRQRRALEQSRQQGVHSFQPDDHRVELRKALSLLAEALLDDKMTLTEGCLRICALAPHLPAAEQFRQEYGVLFHVSAATAHIPILENWKALGKDEQKRFDQERKAVEVKYREAVIEAAHRLKKFAG